MTESKISSALSYSSQKMGWSLILLLVLSLPGSFSAFKCLE